MIHQSAEIVEIGSRSIWIKAPRKTACGSCAAQSSCGQNLWSRFFEERQDAVEVKVDEAKFSNFKIGTQVVIGVPGAVILHGSLRIYIMPLLTMLAAVGVGQFLFGASDGATISSAAFGLAIGFLAVRRHAQINSDNPNFHPVLLEVLGVACPPETIPITQVSSN
ncbi:MAG: SoxR reducing system RseC family protein [Pseudomonadales bacterium]|nr:SoxR reducing system RseC family protein [Pseudomonadales bacterium]